MPHYLCLQVSIYQNGVLIDTRVFTKKRIVIGRDGDIADLVLMSTHVSREHAALERQTKRVFIEDLGSKNGVFVGKEKVQRAEINSDVAVTVGDFALKLKVMVAAATAEAPRQEAAQKPPLSAKVAGGTTVTVGNFSLAAPLKAAEPAPLPKVVEERKPLPPPPAKNVTPAHVVEASQVEEKSAHNTHVNIAISHEHDDEHDDADEAFVPQFSLAKNLLEEGRGLAAPNNAVNTYVEIMTVQQNELISFDMLASGAPPWHRRWARSSLANDRTKGLRTVRHTASGDCFVECDDGIGGKHRRDGQSRDVASFFAPHGKSHSRGVLRRGDMLSLFDGTNAYYLRYVNPPRVPPDSRSLWEKVNLEGQLYKVVLATMAAHLLTLAVAAFMAADENRKAPAPEFVVSVKKDMELQEPPAQPPRPPPPPKPPEPPEAPHPPARPTKAVHKVARAKPTPRQAPKPAAAPRPVATAPKPPPVPAPAPAPAGILGLLSKKGATASPGPSAAVQAVSNLTAAKVPGNSGSYRVSGLIGKLPTDSGIALGGGGGGLVTKGGAALLRGGSGAGRLQDHGARHVNGMVQKAARLMTTSGGSLDRSLIEKVVNEHTEEIQRCYEKELLHDPSISGRVQVEWVINTEGSVSTVRELSNTVNSVNIVKCIMGAIRTWRFPRPQGGPVSVSYPFILKGIDF